MLRASADAGRGRAVENFLLHPCGWRRGGNEGFPLFLLLWGPAGTFCYQQ